MPTDLAILVRLAVAILLAGALGWEREATGKAAGLRTHMLVGMGAALFVSLVELFMLEFQYFGDLVRYDPIRVIEAIVAAVGFLGAGTIFVARQGDHVKGLTTAASLWATAAVGITVGLERYVLAIGSTLLVLVVLRLLRVLEDRIQVAADVPKADSATPTGRGEPRATDRREREPELSRSR
jgi:putative Mg2+ transporter-C (MgtC) family protein